MAVCVACGKDHGAACQPGDAAAVGARLGSDGRAAPEALVVSGGGGSTTDYGATDGFRALIADEAYARWTYGAPRGTEAFVSFSFFTAEPTYYDDPDLTNAHAFSAAQQTQIRSALAQWSAACGLNFIEVPGNNTTRGDIAFGVADLPSGIGGWGYYPDYGTNRSPSSPVGEIWLNSSSIGSIAPGTWAYMAVLHEVGHTLGFKHPFSGNPTLIASEDNSNNTVMSYTWPIYPSQPQVYDREAGNYLYGTRAAADANGITGTWNAGLQRVQIDGSGVGEMIVGTGWADVIQGGGGNDTLLGGSGDDTLAGAAGADTLDGGYGRNTYVLTGDGDSITGAYSANTTGYSAVDYGAAPEGMSIDLVLAQGKRRFNLTGTDYLGYSIVKATGSAYDDVIIGRANVESTLIGGAGNDTITGTSGVDTILGGAGNDSVDAGGGTDYLVLARPRAEYRITKAGSIYTVSGLTGAATTSDGTDIVTNFEFMQFSDGTVPLAVAGNAPPAAIGTGALATAGVRRHVTDFFTASDADGDTISQYWFADGTAGLARVALIDPSNGNVTYFGPGSTGSIAAAQLANWYIEGGSSPGSDTIDAQLFDGKEWNSNAIAIGRVNVAPTVQAAASQLALNEWVRAPVLFASADGDGDAAQSYRFTDLTAGGSSGYLWYGGLTVAANSPLTVAASDQANVWFHGGGANGTDTVRVEAFDGAVWGSADLAIRSRGANTKPVVTPGATTSVALGATIAASGMFSVADPDGDTITGYEFLDAAGKGSFRIGGTTQVSGVAFAVTPGQLATTVYVASATWGGETVQFRAFDGALRSDWLSVTATTLRGSNALPVIAAGTTTIGTDAWVRANTLFGASDADADAPAQYRFTDLTATGTSGYLWYGGVNISANTPITVAASDLANAWFRGGSVNRGTDTVRVEVNDGFGWGSADVTVTSRSANTKPVVTAGATTSVALGATIAASGMFAANDPDGDAITGYEFLDAAGKGAFRISGVTQVSGTAFAVAPGQLATTVYAASATWGGETVQFRAFDGALWSDWLSVTATTLRGSNALPVVAAGTTTLGTDAWVRANTLFSATDADGDPAVQYRFTDLTSTGTSGYLWYGGVNIAANTPVTVAASDLANAWFRGGSVNRGVDTVRVEVNDGFGWGSADLAITSRGANAKPVVTAGATTAVALGATIAASGMFNVTDPDGDAITGYEFLDAAGKGAFRIGAATQGAGVAFAVSPGQMATTVYAASATWGGETVQFRAFDGALWSDWLSVTATTLRGANALPVVTATGATAPLGGWVQASALFAATDADGDAPAQYRFTDLTATGTSGYLWYGGANVAADTPVTVAASDLANAWFRGGSVNRGTDTIRVEVNDGFGWGSADLAVTSRGANAKPLVTVGATTSVAPGSTIAASGMFAASDPDGDAITAYEFWDTAGAGSFRVGGATQAAGVAIPVTPAQLGGATYAAGPGAGSETVWFRATDGAAWSDWLSVAATTR